MSGCRHCGDAVPGGRADGFCCAGCAAAFELVRGLGLEQWYVRRTFTPGVRPLRPEQLELPETAAYETETPDGTRILNLMVDGLQCAACVWLIEQVLVRQVGIVDARVNMTTRRLRLAWNPAATDARRLISAVTALGYRLMPFDARRMTETMDREDRALLRAMAVAGFAAGNVMLLSISVWAGHVSAMGPATRDLFHWISALIALPAVAYAGLPFFRSARAALAAGRLNMDVPISLGVVLAAGMSLAATMQAQPHAYFDAAVTLLFFLLVGRFLDRRARGRARSVAENLLALNATTVNLIDSGGARRAVAPERVRAGDRIAVAAGERIGVDGTVALGRSDVDAALVTGESVPGAVGPGARVFAGTLNLTGPIEVVVTAAGGSTLLAEIVRLMENAEQTRGVYRRLADRVSRAYAPVVHVLALGTLAGWLAAGAGWQASLAAAVAVLTITCPCALALAVPAVQVATTGRLLRAGILVKSADALERLTNVDTVVFDKTGTLTEGRPVLRNPGDIAADDMQLAAAMAGSSRHPLARALAAAAPVIESVAGLREMPGRGLEASTAEGTVRLGSRAFCGVADDGRSTLPELWLSRPNREPARFVFEDALRPGAAETIAKLRQIGFKVLLLSGDRPAAVADTAGRLGIADWTAECSPVDKTRRLAALAAEGRRVLMVGDGLNDAPALAAAAASMSPAAAADISQTAADIVWQGRALDAVAETLAAAKLARNLARQNIALAVAYNLLAVPLAIAGQLTPLIAAAAMSSSSLLVSLNALRARRKHVRAVVSDPGRAVPGTHGIVRPAVGA